MSSEKPKEREKNITETLNPYGIGGFLLVTTTVFFLNRILASFASFIHIVIFVLYIGWVMFSTFNNKIKQILNIKKELIICFLLVMPISITILLSFVYFKDIMLNNQINPLDVIKDSINSRLILIGFFIIVGICYIIGYIYENINNAICNDYTKDIRNQEKMK